MVLSEKIEPTKRSVTLKDIAKVVGITASATSMALNDSPRISEKTKKEVLEVAWKLGYVASSAGRALRLDKSDALVLVVPHSSQHVFGHNYFMKILTGMSEVCNKRETQIIISTTTEEASGVAVYEKVVRSGRADGAIVTSAAVWDKNIEKLILSGIPTALIGNYPHLTNVISVGIDDVSASQLITRHLIEVHHRKSLVHVAGPQDHQAGIDRKIGFENACALGPGLIESNVIEGDFSEESGVAAIKQLMKMQTPFDGLIFANDEMAYGGLTELRLQGIKVPKGVSIVGFDDFGISRLASPAITTISVPAAEMASLATEKLFERLNGAESGSLHFQLPVSLVIRESCGCMLEGGK